MQIKNQQVLQKELREGIVKKPVRSKAGVTVLTVVLKPRKCDHGVCLYCPGGDDVPQSYTNKSPAIMRALALNYDVEKQVNARMKVLKEMNHPLDKIEVIILGGTFMQYDIEYQEYVIKTTYDLLNGDYAYASRGTENIKKSKNSEEAKKLNEKSKHRVVALCIENRPDNCSEGEIKRMLSYGCTRVELGVQILDDEIYKKINRGHTVKDVVDATQRLKDAGFKVGYHIMPGLPFSNPKKDLRLFKKVFSDEDFKPDQIKIYPCQVIKGSALEKNWKKIGYKPYDKNQTRDVLEEMIKLIPEYCRVMRVMREIPPEKLVAGSDDIGLRSQVEKKLREDNSDVKEIRMREVGFNLPRVARLEIDRVNYKASGGSEIFLQVIDKDRILFGLLRLRLTNDKAIVRELHVYGQALDLGESFKGAHPTLLRPRHGSEPTSTIAQHRGLGKRLMLEAEKISRENGFKKIAVISGVGVREYYKKLGYKKEGEYMVKKLEKSL